MKRHSREYIDKLLATDPLDVLRMSTREARDYFRALADEGNARLEELESQGLRGSSIYNEIINTLRNKKGKKRFTVPTSSRINIREVRVETLYKMHAFLDHPSSTVEGAKAEWKRLEDILGEDLHEYKLIKAWEVIDKLRTLYPERFLKDGSPIYISEILERVVKNGEKPDDILKEYTDMFQEMRDRANAYYEDITERYKRDAESLQKEMKEKFGDDFLTNFFKFDSGFDYEADKKKRSGGKNKKGFHGV